jgi:hypothetical protein
LRAAAFSAGVEADSYSEREVWIAVVREERSGSGGSKGGRSGRLDIVERANVGMKLLKT